MQRRQKVFGASIRKFRKFELCVPGDLSPQDIHRKGAVGLKVLNQLPPKKRSQSHFYSSQKISLPEIAVEKSDAQP